jgi:hypothetical protein
MAALPSSAHIDACRRTPAPNAALSRAITETYRRYGMSASIQRTKRMNLDSEWLQLGR